MLDRRELAVNGKQADSHKSLLGHGLADFGGSLRKVDSFRSRGMHRSAVMRIKMHIGWSRSRSGRTGCGHAGLEV